MKRTESLVPGIMAMMALILPSLALNAGAQGSPDGESSAAVESLKLHRSALESGDWDSWWNQVEPACRNEISSYMTRSQEAARDGDEKTRNAIVSALGCSWQQASRMSSTQALKAWFRQSCSSNSVARTGIRDFRARSGKDDLMLIDESRDGDPKRTFRMMRSDGKWYVSSPILLAGDTEIAESPSAFCDRWTAAVTEYSAQRVWNCLSREFQETIIKRILESTLKNSILLNAADGKLILQRYFQSDLAFKGFEEAFQNQKASNREALAKAFRGLSAQGETDGVVIITLADGNECMRLQREFFALHVTDLRSVELIASSK